MKAKNILLSFLHILWVVSKDLCIQTARLTTTYRLSSLHVSFTWQPQANLGFCSVSKVAPIQCEQELMFCSEPFPVLTQVLSVIQFAMLPFDFKRSFTSTRLCYNFCSDKVFRLDSDRFKNLSDTERSTFNSGAEQSRGSSTVAEQKLLRKQRS